MEIPNTEKYRPRRRKSGEPRSQREELIERFRAKLNEEQRRDHRPLYTYGRLAKKFDGMSDSTLFRLFNECAGDGVDSFGAILTWKLKRAATD